MAVKVGAPETKCRARKDRWQSGFTQWEEWSAML